MERNRLRPGEAIAGACGVALFAVMFLPWYEIGGNVSGPIAVEFRAAAARRGVDLTRDAWQSFAAVDVVLAIAALAAVGLVLLTLTQRSVALPVASSVLVAVLGLVAALLVLIRLIDQPSLQVLTVKVPDSLIETRVWAYVGLALCGGIAVGGFLAMADEGERLAAAEGAPSEIPTRPVPPPEGTAGGERPLAQ